MTTSAPVASTAPTERTAEPDDSKPTTTTTKKAGGGGGGATTTTTAKQATPAAKVESLSVVKKPSCPVQGTQDAPFSSPGEPVVIAWKVTGAPGAAIAVDNPSVYGGYGSDYPASGQLELSFPCEGTSGSTTHTYTVWPQGAKSSPKTITVSARNNP
ncbi:hypothetical protein [Actinokineospora bangkokensis]|uniref:Ig-like domain-containing protein n=1 Tax=Actinokineospora bangkokensis TaxID=1193682 RepID=A0A1Q9LPU9_9PSEU|nr:hypothetical protein [Actinokineospora bangkokensis]OLR94055.1 hypothetical protein BJP25_13855 [Actinokineospora bangkokensis]